MGFQFNFNTISFVLLLISLVLVILSTISAPVVPSFGLGTTSDHTFGIFGYCSSDGTDCISATYPYSVGNIDSHSGWKFASNTRNTLAKIFILCPIAAGINFICWVLIIASHFFSFKMSLISIIFNLLSFIITAVVAVIVILVFVPNVGWTGWILIGAAGANLISLVFLFLTLKFKDESSDHHDINEDEAQDLTAFDEKFNNITAFDGPYNKLSNYHQDDTVSSISKDFTYKMDNINKSSLTKTYSGSSIYNSNPQVAKDITAHDKTSTPRQGVNFVRDGQVNLVNGPNTPVSSNKQMAPNFAPNTVIPTLNDAPSSKVPQLPYPRNSMNNMNNANSLNKNIFNHRTEVEGNKPFTEFYDNDAKEQRDDDSDLDSNFTSVSQRGPNPNYPAPSNFESNNVQLNQQFPQGVNYQPSSNHQQPSNYHQSSNHQQSNFHQVQNPGFQQMPQVGTPSIPNQNYYNNPQYRPQQSYFPQQQRSAPTISDNVLANNPDFRFGTPARRKNNQFIPPAKRNLSNLQSSLNNSRSGPYGAI